MSRRTAVIAAALLVLIFARMPAWREAAHAGAPAPDTAASDDPAHDWSVERTAWQLAPALSHRLGLVLVLEGS
jgi:hypothetical protein